jgi:hypothetical protein
MNSSMVQMKLGDQSAIFSARSAQFFAGKNQILLDNGSIGFAAHPELLISDQYGLAHISSFSFDMSDNTGKPIWATPIRLQ